MRQEFYEYAKKEMQVEAEKLIKEVSLREKEAKRYLNRSLKNCYVNDIGIEINGLHSQSGSMLNPSSN